MKHATRRLWAQIVAAVAQNAYFPGFANGTIYKGQSKRLCVPGLNCYSCPGALGSCPIGALQSVIAGWKFQFSLYAGGLLLLFGMIAGRWICGWLCPFGLFQELLHKLPGRKIRVAPKYRVLQITKYLLLVFFVLLLPMLVVNYAGQGDPWFCKYVCPAGTAFGAAPLIAVNGNLRAALGWLFTWKAAVAVVVIVGSVLIYRFFCRFLCPLGAIYGLLNRWSLYRLSLSHADCTHCGACRKACRMDVDPAVTPNSAECIRCGDCVAACPHSALRFRFGLNSEEAAVPCREQKKP